MRISENVLNAATNAMVSAIDGGSSNGEIQFWSGSQPETLTGTPSGTLLVSVPYDDPAFASASGGVSSANETPLVSTGLEDGNIGFARIVDSSGTVLWDDNDVGTEATNSITVNTLVVSTGVDFEVTSHTFGVIDDTAS